MSSEEPTNEHTSRIDEDLHQNSRSLRAHGLTLSGFAVYSAVVLIAFSGLMNVIGAGAFGKFIAVSVGGSSEKIWLSQVTAIVVTLLGPPIAQAAEYWGRKWFVVLTTLLGFIGCIVVSRSTFMGMAITGEILAAIGYSSQALLNAIASEIVPRRWRPAAQGIMSLTSGLGAAFSLLFGFYMVSDSPEGWRVFWYVDAGLILSAAVLFAFFYNPPPRESLEALTTKAKLRRLDWMAFVLLAFGTILLNLSLTWYDNPFPWSDARVASTFALGVAFLIALAGHQVFLKKDGLFNHEIFQKNLNCALALFCIFVEGLFFFSFNNFFPIEMAILYESGNFKLGLRMSVAYFAAIFSAIAVSIYSSWMKDIRSPTIIGYLLLVIYSVLMATAALGSSNAVFAYPLFAGLGLGIAVANVTTAAQLCAPPSLIAVTSGLVAGVRSFGGSIALPVFNSIFKNTIAKQIPAEIAAMVLPQGLSPDDLERFINALENQDQQALENIPGVTTDMVTAGRHGLATAYLLGFRYVWIAAGAFAFVAAVGSFFFVNTRNDLNMHIDAPLQPQHVDVENRKANEA